MFGMAGPMREPVNPTTLMTAVRFIRLSEWPGSGAKSAGKNREFLRICPAFIRKNDRNNLRARHLRCQRYP
jgi:hypothetical protein